MSVSVVYWSGTGNTQVMAEAVAKGIEEAGKAANLVPVDQADGNALLSEKAFALGCQSMGAEELEEAEMEPFVQSLEGKISGKKVLLFGSYGWGDGEWMRNWAERMKAAGADLVEEEGIIVNEAPGTAEITICVEAGKKLALYLPECQEI